MAQLTANEACKGMHRQEMCVLGDVKAGHMLWKQGRVASATLLCG